MGKGACPLVVRFGCFDVQKPNLQVQITNRLSKNLDAQNYATISSLSNVRVG